MQPSYLGASILLKKVARPFKDRNFGIEAFPKPMAHFRWNE